MNDRSFRESSTARQRRHRARQRAGMVCLSITVDETALAVLLVDAGLLDPAEADDHEALRKALERQVALLCQWCDA